MDIDPEDVFGDEDDPENEFYQERDATKEFLVYLVDASPKMFSTTCPSEDQKYVSHFEAAISCISVSLKTQIINRSYDEVAICFFNAKEKKNLQDLTGVYVFNVPEREDLDRPTARLIKEFDRVQESFSKQIGSKYGILPGTRDNSLYNALWAAQALLRKGSTKTADKRILLFTNEDDPFGNMKGVTKLDMMRTTIQRAKDAQDLGISIELLPFSKPDDDFNVSTFYADLLGLEGTNLAEFKALAVERFEDIKDQLRKRMFRKRKVRRINFIIAGGKSIELNTYAVVRPTNPGNITWLDSVTNLPLKAERSFFCSDTGALLQDPPKYIQTYKSENIMFTADEVSEIKRVSTGHLRLLGFKPLSCLKDYHNLRPSTFVFPSDEEVVGSTCIFIALHRSMLRLKRFAVAFYGNSTHPQLVALIAQDEIMSPSGQIEPPGMHMIYLPYSDDIRPIEEFHTDTNLAPRASEDQIKSASSLLKRIDLKNFSVCQFANPALQKHYAVLQALALDEDDIPDVKDETLPDEEGLARPGVVKALEELKICVYGENFKQEDDTMGSQKTSETSNKRKAVADNATKEYANYDWPKLADNGQLKELTVSELKHYLNVHNLPVGGKKEALISRILTQMGK
ncbi:ATP-dependent DNA helicase 2 subunit KU70-like [Salvia splendens]|uniref:ATP-dependent DNA helicase 2 subunit KU70-like n=1 Tax=Salvia splendens TaxID=180675 RepID=UPI001C25E37B|nr:ATP-dependent DNA helicase 2 subunit KU70-like [Salvia splendens]